MNTHAANTQENKSEPLTIAAAEQQRTRKSASPLATNSNPPKSVQMRKQRLTVNNPHAKKLKDFQEMADNSHQTKRAAQLQAMADSRSISSNPVIQLVKMVLIPAYSGQKIDIDDEETLNDLIQTIEDKDLGPEVIKEIAEMPDVLAVIRKKKPAALAKLQPGEDPNLILAKEKAAKDTGGWFVRQASSPGEKMDFLNNVVHIARSVIPAAFNKSDEVGKGENIKDYTNTAYACKEALVHAYAADCGAAGITVMNNYIHPAALERMYLLIRETTPNVEAQQADLTGVCKDFASICYGLILQNDPSHTYNPRLALMHGHVYVEATIGDQLFAVDAWLGGQVIPKAQHEKSVLATYRGKGISEATKVDQASAREYQQSLEASYGNAEAARLIWYKNEANYRNLAIREWAKGKTAHVNRGSL